MNDHLIIVKINISLDQAINYLEQSLEKVEKNFYSISEADTGIVSKYKFLNCKVVFVIFEPNKEKLKDEVRYLYIGDGTITKNDVRWIIRYQIKSKIKSNLVVQDFISNSELDLKNDFGSNSYVSIESSKELIKQLNFIANTPYKPPYKPIDEQTYDSIVIENQLPRFAQLNQHCARTIGIMEPHQKRGEFQRDYERIIHSKAFRRLVDKAQIFTSSKGDHYRTRMTHTLEVAQIARAIAVSLNVNVNLTEAIALAHDIGHTPFGHQGERTLDDILKDRIKIIKNASSYRNPFGGFKHNFQGLRVVSFLEEKYIEFEGLDLTYQVLEGVLKHTSGKIKNCESCMDSGQCKSNCFDLKEFFPNTDTQYLYPEYSHSTTLEGQIVAIADEIAQRGHDLDDAFSSNLLGYQELLEYLGLRKMTALRKGIADIKKDLDLALGKNRAFVDIDELHRSRIVSSVVGFFINDVINKSKKNMKNFQENDLFRNKHRFSELLIDFSQIGKILNNYLDKIISKKVINSNDVSRFDNKAAMIVESLFRAYYNNPKLLHKGTLQRLYIEMRKASSEVIDFKNGDRKLIKDELTAITTKNICDDEKKRTPEENEYWEKRKLLVRAIVDYISGMTDNYAINEYNLIYRH